MMLFVGLGNYGEMYQKTLHNAGFIILDKILHATNNKPIWQEKFSGLCYSGSFFGIKTLFVKPQTYMNNSGICVSQFKNFYKVENDSIFVFHDDIDLKPMQIKIKNGGGHAGHNGLKSLDAHIGKDYHRIRIGVGRPEHKDDVSNFVLSNFTVEGLQNITDSIPTVINLVNDCVKNG